jgi:acetyl esterase/lipase
MTVMPDRPFPFRRSRRTIVAMTTAPAALSPMPLDRARRPPRGEPLVADLWLRGASGHVRARVGWPDRGSTGGHPLVVFLPGLGDGAHADEACRELCLGVPAVVVALRYAVQEFSPAFNEGLEALEWAADHAVELGADPGRLVLAGERDGARLAARLALRARDDGWPGIARQVLVHPRLEHPPREIAPVVGVAPALIATSGEGPHVHAARRYGARLLAAGVPVERLHDAGGRGVAPDVVAARLRQALCPMPVT